MKTKNLFPIFSFLLLLCHGATECQTITSSTGGTVNKLAKFDGTYSITNSSIFDNGTYVGINTSSPAAGIHFVGSTLYQATQILERVESSAYGANFVFRSRKSTWGAIGNGIYLGTISFQGPKTTSGTFGAGAYIQAASTEAWTDNANGAKLSFFTSANGSTTPTARLTIENNGYVGINKTSPSCPLEVYRIHDDNNPFNPTFKVSSSSSVYPTNFVITTSGFIGIGMNESDLHYGDGGPLHINGGITMQVNNYASGILFDPTNEQLASWGSQPFFTIGKATKIIGNLNVFGGIEQRTATGSLKSKITSDGKIWAQEVKVAVSDPYPDFVFKSDYHLMPIRDLKSFIEINGHLPGVPSETEIIQTDGIDLGKMNLILLQKVEELSLYIIQLEDKINELSYEKE